MPRLRNIIFILLALPLFAFLPAQAGAQAVSNDPVQYAVAPDVPGPNQQTLIEVDGVGNFIGDSTITWSVNGKVIQKGIGATRFTFTTGALGTQTVVQVTVDSPSQGTFSRTFTFTPSTVNLVWESDTTVPPLFLGKPLYSAGSPLRVLALPVIYAGKARVAASVLSYQWTVDDQADTSDSGLGRSVLAFAGDQLKTGEDVAVDVYYGSAKVAHGEVVIPATSPALVLYERDPLRGLLTDSAFPASINLLGKEITLQAQPFYFSAPDFRAGNLTYAWQLNGTDASGPDSASGILTLRQTGSGTGAAAIGVSLQNYGADSFVQQAQTSLQLVFGASGSLLNNLFGL
ncbi:MAG: hypothetical protein V4474_02250 [Patescibacteria group bacterium]